MHAYIARDYFYGVPGALGRLPGTASILGHKRWIWPYLHATSDRHPIRNQHLRSVRSRSVIKTIPEYCNCFSFSFDLWVCVCDCSFVSINFDTSFTLIIVDESVCSFYALFFLQQFWFVCRTHVLMPTSNPNVSNNVCDQHFELDGHVISDILFEIVTDCNLKSK